MEFGILLMYVVVYFGLFTSVFFLLTYFENLGNMKDPKSKKLPSVTITVPAYNEEKTIGKTIESLLALNYPKDLLTIMAIDDGSSDTTYEVAKKYEKDGVIVLTKKNGGKASVLNLAISKCTTDVFGALDADSFAAPDSIMNMVGYFDNPEVVAVTPAMKVFNPKTFLQKIQYIEYVFGLFLRKMFSFMGSINVTPGPLTIYRKTFFDKYGGYEENNLTEDIEIALRIQKHNLTIENSLNAGVYTVAPDKFKPLFKQRLRWYIGFFENVFNYRELFSVKYGNLGMLLLPSSLLSIFFAMVMLVYGIFNILTRGIYQSIMNLGAINFDLKQLLLTEYNIFFANLNSVTILAGLTILVGIFIIYIANRMAKEKYDIRLDYIGYIFVYGILFGLWWLVSSIYFITGNRVGWKAKKAKYFSVKNG